MRWLYQEKWQIYRDDLPPNLQRYFDIALAMNQFDVGETFTVQELADVADVHWNTAKKALAFFAAIQKIDPPKIRLITKETIINEYKVPKIVLYRDE